MLISQVPVNRGCWVIFSANIQPTDHTSTGVEYFKPSRSSDHQTKQEFDPQLQSISPSIFLIPHSDHHRSQRRKRRKTEEARRRDDQRERTRDEEREQANRGDRETERERKERDEDIDNSEQKIGQRERRDRSIDRRENPRRLIYTSDFGCRRGKMRERNSVTMKVSSDMIMYEEAEKVWVPEMVKLMKETKEQIVWDNVVLVGDAAHPITPHSSRITNMAILDAAVLGKSLEKRGAENLHSALGEFQSILPVVSKQVLHSRYVGRIKQGLVLSDRNPCDPMIAKPEECQILIQRSVPFFGDAPSILL